MIRPATQSDIKAIATIYEHIHEQESLGNTTTGWLADIYPVEATAQAALERGDLYVYEREGEILSSAIINKIQVDVYEGAPWAYDADPEHVLVLHTLVVEPACGHSGIGREFVAYYEQLARDGGCEVLRMDTNERNVVARKFYAKEGYREAGIVPCEFNGIPGVGLVLLEKKL